MEKKLDEILTHALAPMEEPDIRLNLKILRRAEECRESGESTQRRKRSALPALAAAWRSAADGQKEEGMIEENLKKENLRKENPKKENTETEMLIKEKLTKEKSRIPAAVLMAVLLLGAGSLTAFAAWNYLMPGKVAQEAGDRKLADAFSGDDAVFIGETQSFGGYDVTLLGLVSGEALSEYPRSRQEEGEYKILPDRTYSVAAIANSDGSPMPETWEEAYGELEFFASPLMEGYHPAFYNAASMGGNYTEIWEEGVLYRLVECDNVEIFADRELYFCICDGSFYNRNAYLYDKETGEISRNEAYSGLNALFVLPIDSAKADPEKAAMYLDELGIKESDISEEKLNAELEDGFQVQTAEGNEKGAQAVGYALEFVGNPYEWGGDSLTEGCDCSGFTMRVYEQFGVALPHSSKGQKEMGQEIEGLENALPGDLLFYESPAHVAIYIGEGKVVHAYPGNGICISEADFDEVAAIRRVSGE